MPPDPHCSRRCSAVLFAGSESYVKSPVIRSWRDALESFGSTLPPDSQRYWHVDVFDRWVGHLGLFRRSRVTGRWFQGKHSVHMRGHGQEAAGIAD